MKGWSTLLGCILIASSLNANPEPGATPRQQTFFELYQTNREEGIPNYITQDFLLLGYSLVRRATLNELETQHLLPRLRTVLDALDAALDGDIESPAAKANREFIEILQALLYDSTEVDSKRAQTELDLILAAQGIVSSPLWGMRIDYSRFRPRGRYTQNAELGAYFRTMAYASAVLFAIQESRATGLDATMADRHLAQALALAEILQQAPLAESYRALNDALRWQFGAGDDLRLNDLLALAKRNEDMPARRQSLLEYARMHQRQPIILDGVIDVSQLEPGVTAQDVLTGWRLLPLRYTPDSAALQQLVYDRVGLYQGDCAGCPRPTSLVILNGQPVKGFPSAMELMALLGSQRADEIVKQRRDDQYQGYPQALRAAQDNLNASQGLSGAQLALLQTGFAAAPADAKRLQALLGFWTWQRYLGVLYSKQSSSPSSKGLQIPQPRSGAKIEPATALYRALGVLVGEHQKYTPDPRWDEFANILAGCARASEKMDRGERLSAEDQAFLNALDKALLTLVGQPDQPIVVDVHTNAATQEVLQEGVGFAAIVVSEGRRGARFTHYEFRWPLAQRLTDEEFTALLRAERVPGSSENQ
ncbi:MAG: DUF3160 domain-containing protein [Candidatus Competibacteraceae bacterium]|nr:DUF3160 domain-containing protein [Candidatus Competibacteraceae bacterium]